MMLKQSETGRSRSGLCDLLAVHTAGTRMGETMRARVDCETGVSISFFCLGEDVSFIPRHSGRSLRQVVRCTTSVLQCV